MLARNAKRQRLGLPPLSADGMEVLGEYADYWITDAELEEGIKGELHEHE